MSDFATTFPLNSQRLRFVKPFFVLDAFPFQTLALDPTAFFVVSWLFASSQRACAWKLGVSWRLFFYGRHVFYEKHVSCGLCGVSWMHDELPLKFFSKEKNERKW